MQIECYQKGEYFYIINPERIYEVGDSQIPCGLKMISCFICTKVIVLVHLG